MSGNWLDLSSSSNRYIQTYMKGFLDMSGGNLLLRNNNIIVAAGDISLNGRMFVGNDASLSGRLFVSKDLSLNSKLYVGGDTSMNGNVYARGTIITDASSYTDVKGTFLVENNVNVTGIINQSTINLSGGYIYLPSNVTTEQYNSLVGALTAVNSVIQTATAPGLPSTVGGGTVVKLGLPPYPGGPNIMSQTMADTWVSGNLLVAGSTTVNTNVVNGGPGSLYVFGSVNVPNGNLIVGGNVSLLNNSLNMTLGNITLTGGNVTLNNGYIQTSGNIMSTTGTVHSANDISVNGLVFGKGPGGNNIVLGSNLLSTANVYTINNLALGKNSLTSISNNGSGTYGAFGSNNTTVGFSAGSGITYGNYNTAVGSNSGSSLTTGNNNTFLGGNTTTSSGAFVQSTAVGFGATIGGSNQIVLGTTAESVIVSGNVGIGRTTTPAYQLDVAGVIRSNNLPKYWNYMRLYAAGVTANTYFLLGTIGDWGNAGNGGAISIKGFIGGWGSNHKATVDINIATRSTNSTPNIEGTFYCTSTLSTIIGFADILIYYLNGGGAALTPQYYVYLLTKVTTPHFDLTITGNDQRDTSVVLAEPAQGTTTAPTGGTTIVSSVLSVLETYTVAGNVGIGTTTPSFPLVTNGTIQAGSNPISYTYMASGEFKLSGTGTAHWSIYNQNGVFSVQNTSGSQYPGSPSIGIPPLNILSSGNVGIGTLTPTYTLDVSGTGRYIGGFSTSGIYPGPSQTFSVNSGGQSWTTGVIGTYVAANAGGTSNYPGGLFFQTKNADNNIATVPTTKMVIDASGNMGVGTTAPGYQLDVSGQINANNGSNGIAFSSFVPAIAGAGNVTQSLIQLGSGSYGGRFGGGIVQNSGPILTLATVNAGTTTEVMRILNTNVGIGTTAPTGKLHIYEATGTGDAGAASGSLVIEHGNTGGVSSIIFPSKNNSGAGADYGYIRFRDDVNNSTSAEQGRLEIGTENDNGPAGSVMDALILQKSGGYVGVGTSNPTYTLDVTGTGRFTSDVSINGNLVVGNLLVKGGLTVEQMQNKTIINTTTSNYQLIVTEDISLNGRLFVSGDASLNGRAFVSNNLTIGTVPRYTTLTGGFTTTPSQLDIGGNILSNGITSSNPLCLSAHTTLGGGSTFAQMTIRSNTSDNASQTLMLSGGGPFASPAGIVQAKDVYRNSVIRLLLNPDGGNVGIGRTDPAYTLDVSGTARFTGGFTILPAATASTYSTSYLNDNILYLRTDTQHGLCYGNLNSARNAGVDGPFLFGFSAGALGTTNPSNRNVLTWLNTGNVGIGTTGPQYTLDVSGQLRVTYNNSPGMILTGNSADTSISISTTATSGRNYWLGSAGGSAGAGAGNFYIYDATAGGGASGVRMVINSSGYVGIGTTGPSKLLTVAGDALINGLTVGTGGGSLTSNCAFGNTALPANTTGAQNNSVGVNSMNLNTIGSYNNVVGSNALANNISGNVNCAFGQQALQNTNASNNTAFGYGAGSTNTIGTNNTYLGSSANASANNYSNSTAIGYNSSITASNQIVLGTASEKVFLAGGYLYGIAPITDTFIIDSLTIPHYGITWQTNTSFDASPTGFITSYGGLRFQTGGQTRIAVKSNGNVGIGTTTPQSALDVTGKARFTSDVSMGGNVVFGLSNTNNTTQLTNYIGLAPDFATNQTSTYYAKDLAIQGTNIVQSAYNGTNNPVFGGDIAIIGGNAYLGSGNNGDGTATAFGGNVNIVAGGAFLGGTIGGAIGQSGAGAGGVAAVQNQGSINLQTYTINRTGTPTTTSYTLNTTMTLKNNLVGIGTTAPTYALHLNSAANQGISSSICVTDTTNDIMGLFSAGGYGNNLHIGCWNVQGSTSKNIVMQRLGGFVGIGSVTPTFPLHITATTSSNGIGSYVGIGQNTGFQKVVNTGGTYNPMSIYSAGTIYCNGSFLAGTNVFSSDERIKKNVRNIDPEAVTQIVRKLNPKIFNYIDEVNRGVKDHYGYIAQEVEECLPESVSSHDDYIPNIFETCIVSDNGCVITLNSKITTDFSRNTNGEPIVIRLIGEKDATSENTIIEIIDDKKFRVKTKIDENVIFVFGQKVENFRRIDTNIINAVGMACLKHLDSEVTVMKQQILLMNESIELLKLQNEELKKQLERK